MNDGGEFPSPSPRLANMVKRSAVHRKDDIACRPRCPTAFPAAHGCDAGPWMWMCPGVAMRDPRPWKPHRRSNSKNIITTAATQEGFQMPYMITYITLLRLDLHKSLKTSWQEAR